MWRDMIGGQDPPRMRECRVNLVPQKSEMKINIEKVLISEIAINQDQATFR